MTSLAVRPESTGALATPLGRVLDQYREHLAPFLRDGVTLDRVAAELVLASRTTPGLEQCPAPALVDAVCRALETGGIIGRDVYLVPFKKVPVVMLDYKYKAELVILAGGARMIDAHPVYSDEVFAVVYGSEPHLRHEPSHKPAKGRTLVGAYAIAHMGHSVPAKIHYMPQVEVEAWRAKSHQWAEGVCPSWYGPARCVHRLVKLLPKNPRLAKLFSLMEAEERAEFAEPEPRPAHITADGEDLTFPAAEPQPASDLAWALAYAVPFGEMKGKALGDVTSLHYLTAIQTWAMRQQERPNGYVGAAELERAVTMILGTREPEPAA